MLQRDTIIYNLQQLFTLSDTLLFPGGRIIMGCRDMERCEAAAKEIRGKTLNPHVYARRLDLSSMKSIREFAERIKQGEGKKCLHTKRSVFKIKHTHS